MERVSALMDGEVEGPDADRAMDRVIKDEEARRKWETYHLISDAFRDEYLLSRDFVVKVGARLADEPTVLSPVPRVRRSPLAQIRAHALSVAASVAAVATVGWLAFGHNPMAPEPSPVNIASTQLTTLAPAQPASAAPQAEGILQAAAPVSHVRDYLFAHQEYSPATQIQGVAPYVRTVAEVANDGTK